MLPAKQFLFRRAVAGDSDGIAEAHVASIRSLGAKVYDREIIEDWTRLRGGEPYRRSMEEGEIYFLAIEREQGRNERIVGFSSHRIERGKHRTAVYVRGDSARRGIGTALYSLAESEARRRGAGEIDVDASLGAVGFYRANGFQELGSGEHELRTGRRMACVFMKKTL